MPEPKRKTDRREADTRRLLRNLDDELSGAELYDGLARAERDPARARIFERLAQIERSHAEFWQRKLDLAGGVASGHETPLRVRAITSLARRFGAAMVLPAVHAAELRDRDKYAGQNDAAPISRQEEGHARVLASAIATEGGRGMGGRDIARLEGRHRAGGNALRAAILGANDGLLSNFSLVMGVSGGAATSSAVLLAGSAGLVAGAFSMALGEWLSVTNARELYRGQIEAERAELEASPEEEKEELALIYQAKGIPEQEATMLAEHIVSNAGAALDTLAREELGIDPQELGGSALLAATTSFLLFAFGAAIPLLPMFILSGTSAMIGSIIASGLGLILFGAAAAFITGQGLARGAFRQLAIGAIAAGATYAIGRGVGQALGG